MKRIVTFLLVLFIAQSVILRAQTQITTIVTPKVQLFPTTGLSYLEDPFKYFNVTMTNTSASSIQIYVDLSVSCDFSASGKIFRVNTPNTKAPVVPITIGANQTRTFNYYGNRLAELRLNFINANALLKIYIMQKSPDDRNIAQANFDDCNARHFNQMEDRCLTRQ